MRSSSLIAQWITSTYGVDTVAVGTLRLEFAFSHTDGDACAADSLVGRGAVAGLCFRNFETQTVYQQRRKGRDGIMAR